MKEQFLLSADHPVIRDHVVHGRHVLPGLAYIDLVYQFLRSAGHSFGDWELRDLSIYEPLVVSDKDPVVLTVEASRNPDDSLRILIQSEQCSANGNEGTAKRHVVVQACRVKKPAAFTDSIDLSFIKKSAAAMDVAKIYDRYRELGLAHGGFMKLDGSVYVAEGSVYVDVALGSEALAVSAEAIFSPALLDGSAVCGGVGLAYANAAVSRRLSLPVYFQSFRACAPIQKSCIARLRTDSVRSRSEVSYLTLEFFDEAGLKIAELRDLAGTSGLSKQADAAPEAKFAAAETEKESGEERHLLGARPPSIEQMLSDWFAERGYPAPENGDTAISFADMGVDSAALLQLLRELEVKMERTLSPTLLFEYGSIKELAGHLADAGLVLSASDGIDSTTQSTDAVSPPLSAPAPADVQVLATETDRIPREQRSSDDVERFLCAHLAKKMGIAPDQVNCEATFSELGFDSSGLLSLLQEIEAQIGVELSPVLLFEYRTLKGLAEHLATYQEANFQPPASSGESPATLAAEQAAPRPAAEQPSVRAQEQRPSVRSAARTADSPRQVPRADVPDGSRANGRDIAIIGIDGKFPGAESVEDLWEVLKAGKDCITEIPQERWDYRKYRSYEEYCRWGAIEFCHCGGFIDDVDKFDAAFFNIQPLHADCMDPQQRLFMETVWRLLERAGYTRQRLREDHNGRVGVYVGSMYRDYSHVESDIAQELGSFLGFHSSIANRVSHFFDLSGPSLALDAMCASSAVAIHTACRDLRSGDCELAIVGGTNLSLHHKKFIALSHGRQIGTHAGSRSFSSADGYLPAEAIGAVLLKPLEKAIEGRDHILGVIRSTAVNQSGRSNGYTVPNPSAQAQVIEQCLAEAGADPRTVSYVEATSSGSSLGDPIELVALHRVFSKHAAARQSCPIGTVKSNIGHAEAASTMTQLAKVMLQFEHRQLPPSIKVEPLNPLAEWADTAFHLVHELQEWRPPVVSIGSGQRCYPRRAILNSFGAGGTNVSMLLEEFAAAPVDERRRDEPNERAEIIVFSARAADRLPWMLRQTLEHLRLNPQLSLEDIAYTSQLGREAMEARLALVVSSREELITVLEKSASFDPEDERSAPANLPLFFSGRKQTARGGSASAKSDKALIEMLIKENDAYRLSLLWTQGATIPWRLLHADSTAKIVPLPTYPFRKERHWLPLREHTREIDVLDKPRSAAADSAPSSDAQALIRSIELNVGRRNGVAPRNKVERAIADIWEEVLGIEDIGVTDNFFELGGDSMSAGLVIARCAEMFNVDIDWMILLGQEPTISTFAVTIVSKLANGMNEQELEAALAT